MVEHIFKIIASIEDMQNCIFEESHSELMERIYEAERKRDRFALLRLTSELITLKESLQK